MPGEGYGLGGNVNFFSGQLVITATAILIPLPPNIAFNSGLAILHVCAPAGADLYISSSQVALGDRVPMGTREKYFSRAAIGNVVGNYWVYGASGTMTYSWEWS